MPPKFSANFSLFGRRGKLILSYCNTLFSKRKLIIFPSSKKQIYALFNNNIYFKLGSSVQWRGHNKLLWTEFGANKRGTGYCFCACQFSINTEQLIWKATVDISTGTDTAFITALYYRLRISHKESTMQS